MYLESYLRIRSAWAPRVIREAVGQDDMHGGAVPDAGLPRQPRPRQGAQDAGGRHIRHGRPRRPLLEARPLHQEPQHLPQAPQRELFIQQCDFAQPTVIEREGSINLFQGGAPLHYRDIHWFNAPYIFKYCLKMVTPVLSKVSKGQLVVNSSSKILSIQAHPRLHLPLQQPRRGGQDRRGSGQGARGVRRLPRPNGRHARLREGPRAGGLLQAAPRVGRYVRGDEEQSMMRPGNSSFSYLFGKRRVFMQ